jgi:hypothetical protein
MNHLPPSIPLPALVLLLVAVLIIFVGLNRIRPS